MPTVTGTVRKALNTYVMQAISGDLNAKGLSSGGTSCGCGIAQNDTSVPAVAVCASHLSDATVPLSTLATASVHGNANRCDFMAATTTTIMYRA